MLWLTSSVLSVVNSITLVASETGWFPLSMLSSLSTGEVDDKTVAI